MKPDKRRWNIWEHRGWGNRISWIDYDCRKLVGCIRHPRVAMGDEIACEMQNERIALFRIIQVEYHTNPPDLFFAAVQDVGYI